MTELTSPAARQPIASKAGVARYLPESELMNKIIPHLWHYCNIWQGCQSVKITFEELEKVDVQEIRELLDEE
jgi:hypothetical protein